jgi:hypothetical protein
MPTIVTVPEMEYMDRESIVAALKKDGWIEGVIRGLGDLTFSHPDVSGEDDARGRLAKIGLDPDDVIIGEQSDDQWTANPQL